MKEGILIESYDPQKEVRKNAETAVGWEFKDEAKFLYNLAVIFRDRLVDPIARLDRSQVPDPVISFENLRNVNVLASYTLSRNPQGLLYEISLNTAHYQDIEGKKVWRYGQWAQAESLLHEQLHLWQQRYGKNPYRGGRDSHNVEFCRKAKELGLNVVPVIGCHYQVADQDSPFGLVMREMGIKRPDDIPRADGVKIKDDWFEIGKKRKGRSSLTKWSCGCQNAWIGASEFLARCNVCGNNFVAATAVREVVKEMANSPPEEPKPDPDDYGFDVDLEIDRRQEQEWRGGFSDVDEWEDVSSRLDEY